MREVRSEKQLEAVRGRGEQGVMGVLGFGWLCRGGVGFRGVLGGHWGFGNTGDIRDAGTVEMVEGATWRTCGRRGCRDTSMRGPWGCRDTGDLET